MKKVMWKETPKENRITTLIKHANAAFALFKVLVLYVNVPKRCESESRMKVSNAFFLIKENR